MQVPILEHRPACEDENDELMAAIIEQATRRREDAAVMKRCATAVMADVGLDMSPGRRRIVYAPSRTATSLLHTAPSLLHTWVGRARTWLARKLAGAAATLDLYEAERQIENDIFDESYD